MSARRVYEDRCPEIVAQIDLAAEVERCTGDRGRRDGARLAWRCPLPGHETDSDPSFKVTINPPLFHCFGCDRGGDVITLTQHMEGVTRAEAIERLAARIGLSRDLREPRRRDAPTRRLEQTRSPDRRPEPPAPSYTAAELESWTERCHDALASGRLGHIWDYLRSRGLDRGDVERWRLGFGLDSGPRALRALRGRLVIPCPDGVEARVIPGWEQRVAVGRARWLRPLGDPTRPWGLDRLDRLDPDAEPLVLVEGCFDAFALASCGVPAIALRGKAVKPSTAEAIAAAGCRRVRLGLDRDVPADQIRDRVRVLARAGVRARAVTGPEHGDWGDLLALPRPERIAALLCALIEPMTAVTAGDGRA